MSLNIASITEYFLKYHLEKAVYILTIAVILFLLSKIFSIVMDEDKSSNFRAKVYEALYLATKKRKYEKEYISNDINAKINIARRKLSFTDEYLPKSISVEWVKEPEKDGETYDIKEGEFVVCLDSASSQEKNIVKLAKAIVKRTTLSGIRHLFDPNLSKVIDMQLVKNLLSLINNRNVLDWYFSIDYRPVVEANQQMKDWNNKIVNIDEKGLFTRILLVEFSEFSKKVYGLEPRPFMIGEIEGLVNFLYEIATKKYQEEKPLQYFKVYIKIGIVLVANTNKILTKGITPYLDSVTHKLTKQYSTIYVIIWEKEMLESLDPEAYKKFVEKTEELDLTITKKTILKKDFELKYKVLDTFGNQRNGKCIRYSVA